jgi:hypothetical protein
MTFRLPPCACLITGLLLATGLAPLAGPAHAQDHSSIDLTIRNYGLSIGNAPRVNGVRLNYRDHGLERVNGLNVTLWGPYNDEERTPSGTVSGLAIGLPVTGADDINGIAIGVLGIEAHSSLRGVVVGGLGTGAGDSMAGIAIGGLGMGVGERFTGVGVGGLGIGSGEHLRGLAAGGLGVGAGENVSGIAAGGLGVGAGERLTGVALGGLGVGAGESIRGLVAGGLGVGAGDDLTGVGAALVGLGVGEDITGVAVSGVALGAGGHMRGVFAAGVGMAAPHMTGLMAGAAIGSERSTGIALAPAYFRITDRGQLRGASVSAFNHIKGTQRGLTIGIFNYARVLRGVQLGVLNYAENNPLWLRLLPGLNVNM